LGKFAVLCAPFCASSFAGQAFSVLKYRNPKRPGSESINHLQSFESFSLLVQSMSTSPSPHIEYPTLL
jgi:hypothetical protein